MQFGDLRVFLSEVAFGMIEHNLDQHSRLFSTVKVLQQSYLDMLVMDRQQSRRPVSRDPGKLHYQSPLLYAVPLVRESWLCRGV